MHSPSLPDQLECCLHISGAGPVWSIRDAGGLHSISKFRALLAWDRGGVVLCQSFSQQSPSTRWRLIETRGVKRRCCAKLWQSCRSLRAGGSSPEHPDGRPQGPLKPEVPWSLKSVRSQKNTLESPPKTLNPLKPTRPFFKDSFKEPQASKKRLNCLQPSLNP